MTDNSEMVEPVAFRIGEIVVGGRPGEYPTAVILSIFHRGDRLVTDHKTGRFDEARARRYIERAEQLSLTTGNPLILDVLAETPEAMERYLSFVAEASPSTPFLIDSSNRQARLAGLRYVEETGRASHAIYDSLTPKTPDEELEALRSSQVEAAILLAHNPRRLDPAGRLEVLRGSNGQRGLLEMAKLAGVTKPLVDTVALDLAGLSLAAAAIPLVKEELGLPCGAGSANSMPLWRRAHRISPAAKRYVAPALCTYLQCCGADFILAGPLRRAPRYFSTIAVTDALLAYAPPRGPYPPPPLKTRHHPRYTIL